MRYVVVIFIGIIFFAGGCDKLIKKDPKQEFLDDLRDNPAFFSDGVSVVTLGARGMIGFLKEAKSLKIDLYGTYLSSFADESYRVNLAYLLLLDESPQYLEYFRDNFDSLPSAELRLCTHLLEDDNPVLSWAYSEKLYEILEKSDKPVAVYAIAKRFNKEGKLDKAIPLYLKVLTSKTPFAISAMFDMQKLPPQKADICKTLLDKTPQGAHAAYYMASKPEHRSEAIRYLDGLLDSDDKELVLTTIRMFRDMDENDNDLQFHFVDYIDNPSQEKLDAIIKKLKAKNEGLIH